MGRSVTRALPLGALLVFVAGLSLHPMAESDLFFRIKAGEEILRRHGLPGRNLFSFTYPDYPDLDASWLFEIGAALLHRRGGFPAIVVAKTVVLLATFAAAYGLCRRRGAGRVASALALAAAAFVARERFVERPHVFSFAGEIAVLAAIDALVARTGRGAGRVAAALLAGVALWANFHAGVFVAPLLLAAAALGAWRDGNGAARRLALAAVGAAAAVVATPLGFGIFRYLRLHLVLPALHPVDEFRSPTWVSDAAWFVYSGVVVAVAAAGALSRRGAWRWTWAAAPVGLALLALRSVRFAADVALVSAPILAVGLTALGERVRARWPRILEAPLPTVLAVALLGGFAVVPRLAPSGPSGIGLDVREVPLGAIAFVNENGLRERMYNDFEIGSYLLYDPVGGYPRHRVFVDPRLPAYPPELHEILGRDDLSRDEWTAVMDRYGVETGLLAYAGLNRRVAWWDPERWALVFRERDARVFVRRLPRYRGLIAAHEIPATFAFSVEEGIATLPIAERPAASPLPDCEWQRRLGDLSFEVDGAPSPRALAAYARALAAPTGCLPPAEEARLCAWLGALALGSGRPEDALRLLDRARGRGSEDLTTLSNRALALEGLGRPREAAAAWGEVEARAGESPLATRARQRRARLAGDR